MRMWLPVLAMAAAIGACAPACAEDSNAGVTLPGWRAEPAGAISATSAAVNLDGEKASVTMRLAGAPVRLVLTTPRFGWLGESETYQDRQFFELTVTMNGKAMPLANTFRAYAGGQDVTALLLAAHLDPYAVTLTPPYLEPRDPPQRMLDVLTQAGAVHKIEGRNLAAWTAERIMEVNVQAGAFTTAWRARPAFDELPTYSAGAGPDLRPYCLDAAGFARALGKPAVAGGLVAREYAIAVGIDGRAPADVSLTVTGHAPDEGERLLVAACDGAGGPAIGKDQLHAVRVKPSADGLVRVLAVGTAAAPDAQ